MGVLENRTLDVGRATSDRQTSRSVRSQNRAPRTKITNKQVAPRKTPPKEPQRELPRTTMPSKEPQSYLPVEEYVDSFVVVWKTSIVDIRPRCEKFTTAS